MIFQLPLPEPFDVSEGEWRILKFAGGFRETSMHYFPDTVSVLQTVILYVWRSGVASDGGLKINKPSGRLLICVALKIIIVISLRERAKHI